MDLREKLIMTFCFVFFQLELTNCCDSRIGNRYDDIIGSGISTGECRRLSFAAEVSDCISKLKKKFILFSKNKIDVNQSIIVIL